MGRHKIDNSFTYKFGSTQVRFLDNDNENLNRYLKDISKYKPLSKEEQNAIIEDLSKGGITAQRARDKLVLHNQRYILASAKRLCPVEMDINDFICEGNRGLLESFETFDPKVGASFLRHAAAYIVKYQMAFLKDNVLIKTKNRERVSKTKTDKLTKEFVDKNGREPNIDELLELYQENGVKIRDRRDLAKIPIESMMDTDDDDEDNIKRQYGEIDPFDDRLNLSMISENVNSFINTCLAPMERYVVKCKYGFYGNEVSNSTISVVLGCTKPEIDTILKGALEKLSKNKKQFE